MLQLSVERIGNIWRRRKDTLIVECDWMVSQKKFRRAQICPNYFPHTFCPHGRVHLENVAHDLQNSILVGCLGSKP
jgi:hypothetical protein